jgi:hypothetical protein
MAWMCTLYDTIVFTTMKFAIVLIETVLLSSFCFKSTRSVYTQDVKANNFLFKRGGLPPDIDLNQEPPIEEGGEVRNSSPAQEEVIMEVQKKGKKMRRLLKAFS